MARERTEKRQGKTEMDITYGSRLTEIIEEIAEQLNVTCQQEDMVQDIKK